MHGSLPNGQDIVFRVPGRSQIAIDKRMSIGAVREDLHFFGGTGQRIPEVQSYQQLASFGMDWRRTALSSGSRRRLEAPRGKPSLPFLAFSLKSPRVCAIAALKIWMTCGLSG